MTPEEMRISISKSKRRQKIYIGIILFMFTGFPLISKVIAIPLYTMGFNASIATFLLRITQFVPFFVIVPGFLVVKEYRFCKKIQPEYENSLKRTIAFPILNKYLYNYRYSDSKGFTKGFIDSLGVYPNNANIFRSNDKIEGSYNNVYIERADAYLKYETGSGKNKRVYKYFEGQVYSLEFNKNFLSGARIIDKSDMYAKHENSSIVYKINDRYVEMENEEFNKRFKVISYDQNEVFYLLTPRVMETMLQMKKQLNKQVNFCFIDNKLVICIKTNTDSLSINYNKSSAEDNARLEAELENEMQLILQLVDAFDLDSDMFQSK